jgi:hypothetical protein
MGIRNVRRPTKEIAEIKILGTRVFPGNEIQSLMMGLTC